MAQRKSDTPHPPSLRSGTLSHKGRGNTARMATASIQSDHALGSGNKNTREDWFMCRRHCIVAALVAGLAALSLSPARAAYPERPIVLIVPFAAGGPTDIIARILAATMSKSLGANVVVDNRPGAGGNIGMALVARANPDGYTLLLTSTAIAVNPGLFATLPY